MRPIHPLYVITVDSTGTDSRGRPITVEVESPDPLLAYAVYPTDAEEEETRVDSKYSESFTVLFPVGTEVSTAWRVRWKDVLWDVVRVSDYTHGPWEFGGVSAIIAREGVAANV